MNLLPDRVGLPDIDPAAISALHLFPKYSHNSGQPRRTPKGDPLPGVYPTFYWSHSFDVAGSSELGEILEQLIQRLWEHRNILAQIAHEGGESELFCGIFADGNWDEVLSCELMRSSPTSASACALMFTPIQSTNSRPTRNARLGPLLQLSRLG